MLNIQIDDAGTLHCAKCGATSFTQKRTFASKAVLGVGALLTSKKLKCQACGTYNQTGNAKPFTGQSAAAEDDDAYVPTAEEADDAMAEADARLAKIAETWETPEEYIKRVRGQRRKR